MQGGVEEPTEGGQGVSSGTHQASLQSGWGALNWMARDTDSNGPSIIIHLLLYCSTGCMQQLPLPITPPYLPSTASSPHISTALCKLSQGAGWCTDISWIFFSSSQCYAAEDLHAWGLASITNLMLHAPNTHCYIEALCTMISKNVYNRSHLYKAHPVPTAVDYQSIMEADSLSQYKPLTSSTSICSYSK